MVRPSKKTPKTKHPETSLDTDMMDAEDISDNEADSLLRLSDQARRRRERENELYLNAFDDDMAETEDHEHIGGNDHGDEFDNDYEGNQDDDDGDDDDDVEEEEEDDDDDDDEDERFDIDQDDQYDDEEEEDDEDDEIDPHDFIGRLLQSRIGRNNGNDDNIPPNDPRADFLRAFGSFSNRGGDINSSNNGNGSNSSTRDQSFADVLQRLMTGGPGGIISNVGRENSEIDGLINNLNQRDDTYIILESLNELSERLLMMNGITAERIIPSNRLSKSLIDIMNDASLSEELELQLVACRCLYNFLEVNQDFIHDVINNNAIETLCHKLSEITFIDLTEQALQTLEMISRDSISHSQIIENNGLTACLQYLDFLTIHSQRKCLTIVANCCNNIVYDNFSMINDVFENISNVVKNHSDSIVIENGWLTISRTIQSFRSYPDLLEKLFLTRSDLLNELVSTIVISSNKSALNNKTLDKVPVNFSSCISLIKSLIILASTSVDISAILLNDISIGENIIKSINKYKKSSTSHDDSKSSTISPLNSTSNVSLHAPLEEISIEAIMAAPNELLSQFLTLIGYLLPISYSPQETPFLKNSHEELTERVEINEKRIELYSEVIQASYNKFINEIWLFLINSFQGSMDFEVRRKILINIFRIVKFYDNVDDLNKINNIEMVSYLLASIVNQNKTIILKDFEIELKNNEKDTEMLVSGDEGDSDLDVNDADEEIVDDKVAEKRDNSSKLNANISLLSTSLIILNLIRTDGKKFIDTFEKEGLISDILLICTTLNKVGLTDNLNDDYEKVRPYSSSYNNRFADMEFTKDYEYKLTSKRIYNKLLHITCEIEETYKEFKKLGDSLTASVTAENLQEIKEYLLKFEQLNSDDWETVWDKFKFSLDHNISSFELISSGIIEILTNLFTKLKPDTGNICYVTFMSKFFVKPKDQDSLSPASVLIDKLQEALTRTESFEIVSASGGNSLNNSRFSSSYFNDNSQTAGMAKQIKLRLLPDNSGTSTGTNDLKLPGPMQNMILSVHAIATFSSIDNFLKQRLRLFDQLSGTLHRGFGDEGNEEEDSMIEDVSDEDNGEEAREHEDNENNELMQEVNDEGSHINSSNKKNAKQYDVDFLINGEIIPNETTIYGAIYRSLQKETDEIIDGSKIWNTVHLVSFRKHNPNNISDIDNQSKILYNSNNSELELENYDRTTISILKLLKILFGMNNSNLNNTKVPNDKFMNWKLSVKLNRQLEEPLIVASGTLPGWAVHITRQFPFIFPLDTRIFFLQSTSFGYSRLIHQWQIRTNQDENNNSNGNNNNLNTANQRPQLGRPSRHKVRISRKQILQSGMKVLGLYGATPGVLEIEYFDEVGSGLGPTLEFYSTVSKEFSKRKLKLWRDDNPNDNKEDYINNSTGLFPMPMSPSQLVGENGKKTLYLYSILGKFIARSLLDSRIIDFKFNKIFLRLVQIFIDANDHNTNSNIKLVDELKNLNNISNLRMVDPYLADSMEHLMKYVNLYPTVDPSEKEAIKVDNCTLEDLSLTFQLPGYPNYELKQDGENILINSKNVEEYITKVIEATLYSGIISQIKAFMDGFSTVFPISSLIVFTPEELVDLFGNAEEDWSYSTLYSSINANHGYNKDSSAIKSLVEILIGFNNIEKRSFLQFLTGAPKLPIGGFRSLKPELTVVRKYPEGQLKDDDYLPSVMTCANYLKLPNYSSEAIMKEKLLQAVNEGAGAFLLS